MEGWFCLHRQVFSKGLWQHLLDFRLFIFLIGNAVYEPSGKQFGELQIVRGQFLRSIRKLQDDLQYYEDGVIRCYSTATISRSIERLEKDGRIQTQQTKLGTLFSICNYAQYQDMRNSETPLGQSEQSLQLHPETTSKQERNNTNKYNNTPIGTNQTSSEKPFSIQAAIFSIGVPLLTSTGNNEPSARSFLGRLISQHDKLVVLDALEKTLQANAGEPKSYLVKLLQGSKTPSNYRMTQADWNRGGQNKAVL